MLAEKIIKGDSKSAAQLMRRIDDDDTGIYPELEKLFPHTGSAHIIGLTGSPGVGKSTLVDALTRICRKKGKRVGILAVDPTSPYSGGAILGDRVRMQQHAEDDGVFIKSIATRGNMGGLSRSAFGIVSVMEAMGLDIIIVETVGAGQDEVDIIHLAHTTIVVIAPDMGDGIQAAKSGILETADIFALNKIDLTGWESTLNNIKTMLAMRQIQKNEWTPPIIQTEAHKGRGVAELLQAAEKHIDFVKNDAPDDYRKQKSLAEFSILFDKLILERIRSVWQSKKEWQSMLKRVAGNKISPYRAANELVEKIVKQNTEVGSQETE